MSNFSFLQHEWPLLHEAVQQAETLAHPDPRASCFYVRRALELAIAWAYKHDPALKLPYQDNINALIHEPSFKKTAGEAIFNKAILITKLGNQAVHSQRFISITDATQALRDFFHIGYWLARTYARGPKPPPGLDFQSNILPNTLLVSKQSLDQLKALEQSLHERDEKLTELLADKQNLDEELKRLRREIEAVKHANEQTPDAHDYSEAQTRDFFIDLLLKEAGWPLDKERDREFEVQGMRSKSGLGYVDYVLWGDDDKPLAVVEAKRTRKDARIGQEQAKLYADCLEKAYGRRPLIFYTNGYEHWLWDDVKYPPRRVQGFYKKEELELCILRRSTQKALGSEPINENIVERYYQTRAIRKISESFERDAQRKALLVMATGAGKTRTVVALCDLLIRCRWVKRVLFLADRVALVNQAVGVFKKFLPDSSPVNLTTEKNTDGRVYVSTYPSMMSLIEEMQGGTRRFGVGHFDLLIIDEAHRSVFQKYKAIFDYFDAFLVGLTATPKDEVDRNTYGLFELENGVPTDAYSLEEAVKDGFLVPPRGVSVPLRFQREGIKYNELSEEEKEQWDELDWDEDGVVPDRVEPEVVNKWLFNVDTVDKVLAHLMTEGLKVAGGDRLGKTILFAKNQRHADFIAERFNANYPHYKGMFARVITHETSYAQSIIDDFSKKDSEPHLAISVDMLDTGIDVREVLNLVFFKLVRSKTKFWQMIGRGTRLCEDLFGPGRNKHCFQVFDYCGNLEFFSQNLAMQEGRLAEPLGKRRFKARLEVLGELDKRLGLKEAPGIRELGEMGPIPKTEAEVRADVGGLLHAEVAAMNVENFVVRPKRRSVEKYAKTEAWKGALSADQMTELSVEVAGLPSELPSETEEAKRFDLLVLNVELAMLRVEPAFERLRDQVKQIGGLLEEKASIPMVKAQMELILDIQTDEWWQDVTLPMLEKARRGLRDLVKLIDKKKRKPIYTDFEDAMGESQEVDVEGFAGYGGTDHFEKFKAKARVYLRAHQDHIAIAKLRMNKALTAADLGELERMLVESGVGGQEEIERAKAEAPGLGLFVRKLVGLDREAAKGAFAEFLKGKKLSGNQIEFVNLIVDHLTEHGVMEASRLYESPFRELAPQGPEVLLGAGRVGDERMDELIAVLDGLRASAAA